MFKLPSNVSHFIMMKICDPLEHVCDFIFPPFKKSQMWIITCDFFRHFPCCLTALSRLFPHNLCFVCGFIFIWTLVQSRLTHLTSFSHVGHVFFFPRCLYFFICTRNHMWSLHHTVHAYSCNYCMRVFFGTSDLFCMWTCSFVFQIFSWCRVDLNAHNHMWFVDSSHVVSYIFFFFCIINFFFPPHFGNVIMFTWILTITLCLNTFFFKGFMFAFHVHSDIRVCLLICREKYMMYAMWFCANRHMLILHM